jgi:hypothetical protein
MKTKFSRRRKKKLTLNPLYNAALPFQPPVAKKEEVGLLEKKNLHLSNSICTNILSL